MRSLFDRKLITESEAKAATLQQCSSNIVDGRSETLNAIDLAILACPGSDHHHETGMLLLRHCPTLEVVQRPQQQSPTKRSAGKEWTEWVGKFITVCCH